MHQPCDAAPPPIQPITFPTKNNTTIKIPTMEQPAPHNTNPTNQQPKQPPQKTHHHTKPAQKPHKPMEKRHSIYPKQLDKCKKPEVNHNASC